MSDGDSKDVNDAAYVAYFIVSTIAIIMTSVGCFLIVRWGDLRFSITKLMLTMHGTILLEEIFNLPFAFSWNNGLCAFAAFVQTYCGLANAISTAFLMIFFYCSHTCNERIPLVVSSLIRRWSAPVTFLFPLITLLPFSTNSYGVTYNEWCRIKVGDNIDSLWSLFVYHLWSLLAIVASGYMITKSISAACKIHATVGGRLFTSLGMYAVMALVCWTTRVVINLWAFSPARQQPSSNYYMLTDFIIQCMGIGYSLILFYDISMVLDMRSGSEVFRNSSILSSSILNWETLLDNISDLRKTTVESPIVERASQNARASNAQLTLDVL